jgi:hypothetical protein
MTKLQMLDLHFLQVKRDEGQKEKEKADDNHLQEVTCCM